ncbi:uncharacterized protein V2V93DRAFT_363351 [Kockiozyma suomiensis]|uniref:uncharacterized protein n=1 Tax=Kockiozyma suomiensis TaxID=1337062 RepID=UPI003343BD11
MDLVALHGDRVFDFVSALSRARALYPYYEISPTPISSPSDLDMLLFKFSFSPPPKLQIKQLYIISDAALYAHVSATITENFHSRLDIDLDDSLQALLIRIIRQASNIFSLTSMLSLEMHLACVPDDDIRSIMDARLRSGGPTKYALKSSQNRGRRSVSVDATLSFSFYPETMVREWCAAEISSTSYEELQVLAKMLLLERAEYDSDWRNEYFRVDAVVGIHTTANIPNNANFDRLSEHIGITWWRANATHDDVEILTSQFVTSESLKISFDLLMMSTTGEASISDEFRHPASWMLKHSRTQVIEMDEIRVRSWVHGLLASS